MRRVPTDLESYPTVSTLPRPMPGRLAFSYSGLHSTVERFLDARGGEIDERTRVGVARSFQRAAVRQLEDKLALGIRELAKQDVRVGSLVVSGGVASNAFLRERRVLRILDSLGRLMETLQVARMLGCGEHSLPSFFPAAC